MGERNHGMKRGIKPTLFQLISSYVIQIKNICLQVRAPSVGKGFLKSFTALCYIKFLASASHLLLLAIRGETEEGGGMGGGHMEEKNEGTEEWPEGREKGKLK